MRAALDDAGYSEARITASFGGRGLQQLRGLGRSSLRRRLGGDSALHLLLRLFAAEEATPVASLSAALGAPAVEGLIACGLAVRDGSRLRPQVVLEPFGDLKIAADRRTAHRAAGRDYVPAPGPGTRRLAEHAVPLSGARVLDLGCGSGALALFAASRGATVTGVDVSERAVGFARFNSALNGLDGVELRTGDLFAPVAGRRFDRVLCNPPYVISPGARFTYRDGEKGLCARIVAELASHLEPGGVAQVLCNWPHLRGRDWRRDLAAWFEGGGCDALVLADESADAVDYATLWLWQEHESEPDVDAHLDDWLAFYSREGVDRVGAGMVVLRRTGGREPWLDIRATPASRGPGGESLAGLLVSRDRALTASDAELLDTRLSAAPGLELRERRPTGDGRWGAPTVELRLARGYAFTARVDPVAAAIVGALDGDRTLREAAAAAAGRVGLPAEVLSPGLPALARRLMGLGLLRDTTATASSAAPAPPPTGGSAAPSG